MWLMNGLFIDTIIDFSCLAFSAASVYNKL